MKNDRPRSEPRRAHRRASGGRRNASDTRERILAAAFREFADKGLDGARVDEIASRAGVNKGMLYHYFGNKDRLFSAALERLYITIRAKQGSLEVRNLKPEQAMRKLIAHTAEIWMEHPDFFGVLNSENLHQARHVKRSKRILQMYEPVLEQMEQLLAAGSRDGTFRKGIDPLDLYITISALGAHYISNHHTLGALFRTKLLARKRWAQRCEHITDVVMRYLKSG
jgi:TetR/AcrR family transcriptional regulator